jgi:hypothetical protein
MITDEQAEAAGQWIYDNVQNIADAKAEKAKSEELLRVVKSEVMLRTEGTQGHKEATAFASSDYREALDRYTESVRAESFFITKLKAADTKIELYRTSSANLRGLK